MCITDTCFIIGSDYNFAAQTLSEPGSLTVSILNDNNLVEGPETFTISWTLVNPAPYNVVLVNDETIVTILDSNCKLKYHYALYTITIN